MKPMNIEFLSKIAKTEKEIPVVCSDEENVEVFEHYLAVLHERSIENE
jgi:hypothetical protein